MISEDVDNVWISLFGMYRATLVYLYPQLNDMTTEQINKILHAISNRRKFDKFSIAYDISAMDAHNPKGLFVDSYKRDEIIAEFTRLINIPECAQRIANFNTIKQILS